MRSSASKLRQGMSRHPSNTVQIAIRVPPEWLAEADAVAQFISRPGFPATRTDAFRAGIAKGFEAFKAEAEAAQETATTKGAKPARKPVK